MHPHPSASLGPGQGQGSGQALTSPFKGEEFAKVSCGRLHYDAQVFMSSYLEGLRPILGIAQPHLVAENQPDQLPATRFDKASEQE